MSRLNTFLSGVKVLDFSQYIPGPMASLILADMGADVLKIEPPSGDEMRNLGPRDSAGAPLFYGALNAGKRVRCVNLKDEAARGALASELAGCDILIEGFRPGVMKRLGLDYGTLAPIHPGLIYCSINGFGARGNFSAKAAHDGNYLAMCGVLARNGSEAPVFYDPPISDTSGSLFAVIAILGALHARRQSGRGCNIDLGLADVAMPLQLMQIADFGANAHVPKPRTTYLNGGAAYYQIYPTRDGRHVMLGSVEPKFWRAFCEAAGRPEWIARQSEPMPQTALMTDIGALIGSLTLDESIARFEAADCCFSPVLDLAEAVHSEHVQARGLVRRGDRSGDLQALFPAYVDNEPPAARRPVVRELDGSAATADWAAQ